MARRRVDAAEVVAVCGTRAPRRWRDASGLGQEIACSARQARRLGQSLELQGQRVSIVACGAPTRPKPGRRCESSYLVEGLPGVRFAVPASRVRERTRTPRLACDRVAVLPASVVRAWHRAGLRNLDAIVHAGELPLGDLPFPHRRAGDPCCAYHADARRAEGARDRYARDVRAEAERRVSELWDRYVSEGIAEPWDDPDQVRGFQEEARAAERQAERDVGELPEHRELLEHDARCRSIWSHHVERRLGRGAWGSYQSELAELRHRMEAAEELEGFDPDAWVGELEALRDRWEIGSRVPLRQVHGRVGSSSWWSAVRRGEAPRARERQALHVFRVG